MDFNSYKHQAEASRLTLGLIPHPLVGGVAKNGPFWSPMDVALRGDFSGPTSASAPAGPSTGASSSGLGRTVRGDAPGAWLIIYSMLLAAAVALAAPNEFVVAGLAAVLVTSTDKVLNDFGASFGFKVGLVLLEIVAGIGAVAFVFVSTKTVPAGAVTGVVRAHALVGAAVGAAAIGLYVLLRDRLHRATGWRTALKMMLCFGVATGLFWFKWQGTTVHALAASAQAAVTPGTKAYVVAATVKARDRDPAAQTADRDAKGSPLSLKCGDAVEAPDGIGHRSWTRIRIDGDAGLPRFVPTRSISANPPTPAQCARPAR